MLASLCRASIISTAKDDSPFTLSLLGQNCIVGDEGRFVAENPAVNAARTKICWYMNGAVVVTMIPHNEVFVNNEFVIPNLSASVNERSIVVSPPPSVVVSGYNARTTNTQCCLHVTAQIIGTVSDNDLWKVQYITKDVSWSAYYYLEFTPDQNYVTFRAIFRLDNSSGILFQNIQILFFESEIANEEQLKNAEPFITPHASTMYKHFIEGDLGTGRDILWCSATRVPVSKRSGLFVGGKCLRKMDKIEYPRVQNWITFPNTADVGLGKALPSGIVSVHRNQDGFTPFMGYSTMNAVRGGDDVTIRTPSELSCGIGSGQRPVLGQGQAQGKSSGIATQGQGQGKSNSSIAGQTQGKLLSGSIATQSLQGAANAGGGKDKYASEEFSHSSLDTQLIQEYYRMLAPNVAESEYKLVLKNPTDKPVQLTVTIDQDKNVQYLLTRSSLSYDKNKQGNVVWTLDIPAFSSREIKYKLTLKLLNYSENK
jgi:hypothetical protein